MEQSRYNCFTIYGLADPLTHLIRYVGKTNGPVGTRYAAHARGCDTPTQAWVRTLAAPPVLVVLETGPDAMVPRKDAPGQLWASSVAEVKWIKRFRRTVVNKAVRDAYRNTWDWLSNPDERRTNGKGA